MIFTLEGMPLSLVEIWRQLFTRKIERLTFGYRGTCGAALFLIWLTRSMLKNRLFLFKVTNILIRRMAELKPQRKGKRQTQGRRRKLNQQR